MSDDADKLPVNVLTGFLGSGKTALLRGLLQTSTERIAVLVNEVGELALDHLLLEHVDDEVFALPGGCLCCAVQGELHAALARICALSPTRIVLETSGLVDPAPLLHGIGSDPTLAQRLRLTADVAAAIGLLLGEMGDITTGTPLDWLPFSGLGGN